jgi:hypothetical protein
MVRLPAAPPPPLPSPPLVAVHVLLQQHVHQLNNLSLSQPRSIYLAQHTSTEYSFADPVSLSLPPPPPTRSLPACRWRLATLTCLWHL